MKKCDIIIPVWNELESTKECIDSVKKHTGYPYRFIIIDNASDEYTANYLNHLKDEKGSSNLILVRNDENRGFVKAVNQGMAASSAPYLCIMNNDTIVTDGWLEEMIAVMEATPTIGLLNPSSNTSGQFPDVDESIDEYALRLRHLKGQIQELYTCRGFCMLMKRSVIEKVGFLDEVYHLGYFDDTDYCKRAQGHGVRTARAKAAYVYHKENVSFKALDDNKALFQKNEQIFFDRWGRPVRVGYFIDMVTSQERIDEIATAVAREGHQILIFLKKGLEWPVKIDHFDIRRFDIPPSFFEAVSIYKILKRKKKKKLDILMTDNKIFGQIMKAISRLHGADVLIQPEIDSVAMLLDKKSRER